MNAHLRDDTLIIPSLREQVLLASGASAGEIAAAQAGQGRYFSAPEVDLDQYDHLIVCASGGKDSIACLLRLIEMGADMSRVEHWHHEVDGAGASTLMDWPFMRDYNRKLAEAFNLPLYFSWLEGGLAACRTFPLAGRIAHRSWNLTV